MAADLIRVRLNFDYAPPGAVGCRMCWLLVDRGSCRVVADLESIIREKFELSHGSIISLFIEDCYLPHTESVLVVRDNDCVRVKVETVTKCTTQPSPGTASENNRKRSRPVEDDVLVDGSLALELKKKKRRKSLAESTVVNGLHTDTERTHASPKQNKKKKRKQQLKSPPAPQKPTPSVKKAPKSADKMMKATKKPTSSSSSCSSSSEDEQHVKKVPSSKLLTKPAPIPNTVPAKVISNDLLPLLKPLPPAFLSSSDTDSSSSEKEQGKNAKTKSAHDKTKAEDAQTNTALASNGADNSEQEEIELVIKKPVQHPQGRILVGKPPRQQVGRGRGKGNHAPREPWSKGRGRGNCVQFNYNEEGRRDKEEPSYCMDTLTNVSVVLQNGGASLPKTDYSSMPLLAAPPQVGQKIAFKLLELTENYTPEVSDYKEAKILSFDPTAKQIELELLTSFRAPVEPGKFDLVYQNPDGSESVEYAVDRGFLVTERWDSLLEPRLLI